MVRKYIGGRMRKKGLYSLKYTFWRYRTELTGGSRSGHSPGEELLGDKMTSQHGIWLRISLSQLLFPLYKML